jgi:hypothetical protein
MATLLETYTFYTGSANVKNRAFASVLKAADGIMSEDVGTLNHAARLVWAKAALVDPHTATNQMWAALATTATIVNNGEACTDIAINNAVATRIAEIAASNS